MKNLYYSIIDTTRESKNPSHAHFWHLPICNDFAGAVTAFAKRNKITTNKVRLYFYETKAQWERAEREWVNKVDWSIPALP